MRNYPKTPPRSDTMSLVSRKRWWKRFGIGVLIVLLVLVAAGLYKVHALGQSIFVKNSGVTSSHTLITQAKSNDTSNLKKPGDGRLNIVVLGIGGVTDAGQAHDGTLLTDSIQVVSLDLVNKKVGLTSVPRDFYVDIPGHGPNKINAVYEYGEADNKNGGQAIKNELSTILGVPITNFVVIDFTAAKDIVDTLGGIDVNVPKALYDPTYPAADEIHFDPFSITAGPHHMDGTTALKYMRTRHADSDFGRSARQQLVAEAIKQKALSLGMLANPVKVLNMVNILGTHIKTDLQPSDITSLISEFKDVNSSDISNNVLDTTPSLGLLTDTSSSAVGYVEYPIDGYTSYSAIQHWFQKNNPDPYIGKEAATVSVANAGTTNKKTLTFAQKLADYGFAIQELASTATPSPATSPTTTVKTTTSPVASATVIFPTATDTNTTLYVKKKGAKPVTERYLESVLGLTAQVDSSLTTDFAISYTGD